MRLDWTSLGNSIFLKEADGEVCKVFHLCNQYKVMQDTKINNLRRKQCFYFDILWDLRALSSYNIL